MTRNGFTVLEALFAIALAGILLAIATPSLVDALERVRHDSAVRQVVSDLSEARAQAISTGWEFRIVGYDGDAVGGHRNQYRMLAHHFSAAWPDEDAPVFQSSTQRADRWVDITSSYPGVYFDSDDGSFEVTFDSRGASADAAASFNPLRVIGKSQLEASLTVSVVGGIKVE